MERDRELEEKYKVIDREDREREWERYRQRETERQKETDRERETSKKENEKGVNNLERWIKLCGGWEPIARSQIFSLGIWCIRVSEE